MDFTHEERQIFPYRNGVCDVHGDPLEIELRLTQALGEPPNRVLAQARSGDAVEAATAKLRLIDAAREAFVMAPWNPETGEGATARQCWDALHAYGEFLNAQKKSAGSSPRTSSTSGPSWHPPESTTEPTSDSGPTENC